MTKDSEPRRLVTSKELARMTLPEKVKRYAQDVMLTENNPQYLSLGYQVISGSRDGEHTATYPAEEGRYIYSFLFGGGSLGHPMKPTIVGEAVYEVARLVGGKVFFMDFTFANFNKQINAEAIETAFYPMWENSERMKAEDKGNSNQSQK